MRASIIRGRVISNAWNLFITSIADMEKHPASQNMFILQIYDLFRFNLTVFCISFLMYNKYRNVNKGESQMTNSVFMEYNHKKFSVDLSLDTFMATLI